MRKTNKIITIVLAMAAAAAWGLFLGFPWLGWYIDAETRVSFCVTLSVSACFGWLLLYLSERRGDNETRCRKCGYILRGLSEPRCPECGERI